MGGKRNTPKGTLLNAAAGVVGPPPGDPLCAVYESALRSWCRKPVGSRGDFNDEYFKKLKDKALKAGRELPLGYLEKGKRTARGITKLAKQRGATGAAARALEKEIANATPLGSSGWGPHMFRMLGAAHVRESMGAAGVDIERVLVPDAIRLPEPGSPVEVKRPTEGESHDGQLRNYAKASPTGKCELVNCHACELECQNWGGDCPPRRGR